MTKILLFYPHNPSNPQHGSHLRALQQIQGLLETGQIYLASSIHTSDTPWPEDLGPVTEKLGVKEICIYERSHWGLADNAWLTITWLPQKLDAVFRRMGLHRFKLNLRSKGRGWMMKHWFHRLAATHGVDLVVVNYIRWAWLVEKIDRKIPRVLELHDMISINSYMQETIQEQLKIADRKVMLRPGAKPTGYVTAAAQLPMEVKQRLDMELADIGKFDRVWSITERESKIISEFDASIQIDTIIPDIQLVPGRYERKEYALLPVGPNVFNTYSLLKFIQGIAPRILFPDNAKILITGRLWRHLQFYCPPRVEYLGMVDNYQKVLGSARFVIVPTATGTGQQIKIFEALAYGIPVVCFRAAVPGFMDSYANGVVCVDTDEEFAEAVGRMWRDESFYQQLLSGAKAYSFRPGTNAYAQSVNQLLAELS